MFANKVERFRQVLKPATELILNVVAGFGDPKDWKMNEEESKILLKIRDELKKEMVSEIRALHELSGPLPEGHIDMADRERFFNMVDGAFIILMLLCEKELFYRLQIRNAMIKVRDHTQKLKPLTINEAIKIY